MFNLPIQESELIVELGQITISAEASKEFSLNELFDVLHRQATGDWGYIDGQELDWNEYVAKWGVGELLSRFGTPDRGLIVTTDDSRSETQQHNITNVYTNNEY